MQTHTTLQHQKRTHIHTQKLFLYLTSTHSHINSDDVTIARLAAQNIDTSYKLDLESQVKPITFRFF